MKRYGVCLFIAVAGGVLFPAYAQDYAGKNIGTVKVEGLSHVSEQLVRSRIEVQPGQPYNPRAIARDIRRLYELGHFANIKADAALEGSNVVLAYIFEEKRIVDEIKIIGNDKLRTRAITAVLQWKVGDSFVADGYDSEREAILKLYQSKGFPNASVDMTVEELGASRVRVTYAISEGRKARIRSIAFDGNQVLSDRSLRKLMKTKRAWWFLGGKYDETKFEADLQSIVNEYGNYGRLEAEVANTDFAYSETGKGLGITIRLAEGPEYTVKTMAPAGNEVYDRDEVERIVKVHAGDVHNRGQVSADADLIRKGYEDSGYVNAAVTPQVTLDRENKTTHVVHQIEENSLKYVKEIKITGNSITKDEVIRRELLQVPGERFDGNALRGSQRQLDNTRFFDHTRLTLENIEDDERFSNLLVNVEEGKTGNFNFGAGYSTEEKMSGFAELRLNNFDISNWPTFSGGGQQFSTRISIGDVRTQYNLSFTDPQIGGYPLAFGFDVFDETVKGRGAIDYTEATQGGQLRLGKVLSPYVVARTALKYEHNDISGIPWYAYPALNVERGGNTTISSIWGIARNTTDSGRDPTTGSKHDLQVQIAGLGGDNEFIKIEHDSTWYKSLGKDKKWILSLRTREGWATEYGGSEFIPISNRFFAGGTSTVRGYDTYDIGPKERTFWFGDRSAVGGELRLVNNLEAKYKLTDTVRLYGFIDAGGVWRSTSDFDFGGIRYSAGLGFGVDVPMLGPVRVDYGVPLNADEDQGSGRLHLTTGIRF